MRTFKSKKLLNALRLAVGAHQGIEDGEHVPPIIHHARENVFELRVAFGFAMPLGEHGAGNFDVAPQLIRGMATQEKTVEKSGFALRILEVVESISRNELWHRGHKEKGSLPKSVSASSRTCVFLPRGRQHPGRMRILIRRHGY